MECDSYRASIAVSVEKEGKLRDIIEPSRLDFFELDDVYYEHQIDVDMVHAQVMEAVRNSGMRI